MTTVLKSNTITEFERENITREIESDLVDLFYKASPIGSLTAFLTSLFLFTFFYFAINDDKFYLITWVVSFNFVNFLSLLLYLHYKKHRAALETSTWLYLLSTFLILFAGFYGACVFFLPESFLHQFIAIATLMMIAAALSIGTVGIFKLSLVTSGLILGPLIIWFFLKPEIFYKTWGFFVVIYYIFLTGMNHRSTEWLKNSLRLKIENSYVTHQANHELLTDLPNQRLLLHYIEEYIAMLKDKNQGFAIICFAINRIEMFNNSLGYQAGDLIVQSLAKRLKTVLSEEALHNGKKITRILTQPRPDSFIVLIEPLELNQTQKVEEEIKNLFEALNTPFHLGQRETKLTASVGVSLYPKDGDSARILLSNAYAAMFQARQLGGNQVEYYKKEINEKTPRILELENDMHRALENHEFMVYYQPIIELESGKIAGMEALIRWNHPQKGMIPPNDFIPLAAETGMILPIGEWILEEACRQTAVWHKTGFEALSLKVSVNLSVKQLRQGDLLGTIDRVLAKTGLEPQFLDLELTETEMLDEKIAPLIKEIVKKGVTLSIDDFGTGYSGLSYLKFFEVDKIKIDKSFIDDVARNDDSATIVSAILAMGKELNIKTLAEGVETEEQLQFLKERFCNYIQGYYYSKPIPAAEFTQFLRNWNVRSLKESKESRA